MSIFFTHIDKTQNCGNLSESLREGYGADLVFPPPPAGRPYVITNFVTTLDGIAAYSERGRSQGSLISGSSSDDRWLLALLRGAADAVLTGSGTLRDEPGHLWTPYVINDADSESIRGWRLSRGIPDNPLQCIVSSSCELDWAARVFTHEGLRVLMLTTEAGAVNIPSEIKRRDNFELVITAPDGRVDLVEGFQALRERYGVGLLLSEGGPSVFASLLKAELVDECFQTISPVLAGGGTPLTADGCFTPESSPRFELLSLRTGVRNPSHLFLRYRFSSGG